MKKPSYHILRVGLAVTFLWIGILILQHPGAWGAYLQPWAAGLLPVPLSQAMIGTAVLDMAIGILLLVDAFVWIASLVATIHLLIVLTVSGITEITVRDIAILGAVIALMADALPKTLTEKFVSLQKPKSL